MWNWVESCLKGFLKTLANIKWCRFQTNDVLNLTCFFNCTYLIRRQHCFEFIASIQYVEECLYQHTIFRRMTARTALTVKKPATTIITTDTARFVFSTLIDAIQPLSTTEKYKVCHVTPSQHRGEPAQVANGQTVFEKSKWRETSKLNILYDTEKEPEKERPTLTKQQPRQVRAAGICQRDAREEIQSQNATTQMSEGTQWPMHV